MELRKVGASFKKLAVAEELNRQIGEATSDIQSQRNAIPDSVFLFKYTVDGRDYTLNLRRLFEIDVTELSELTLTNLRTQLEQISSIRVTLGRAYEQMMEDYGRFKIDYDIWFSEVIEDARNRYWNEQVVLQKKHDLAKSGLKPPTQDDLLNTMLRVLGHQVDYKTRQEKMISFQRAKSLHEKIDGILNSREYDLKAIIDMRLSKTEPRGGI